MARFVLVHGGWHGGWCFRWLAGELEARGHEVAAPDLPCEEARVYLAALPPLERREVNEAAIRRSSRSRPSSRTFSVRSTEPLSPANGGVSASGDVPRGLERARRQIRPVRRA